LTANVYAAQTNIGTGNTATGPDTTVVGTNNAAANTTVVGTENSGTGGEGFIGWYGNTTTTGIRSTAIGSDNTTDKDYATAVGNNITVNGQAYRLSVIILRCR
jgi:hypothetical protein